MDFLHIGFDILHADGIVRRGCCYRIIFSKVYLIAGNQANLLVAREAAVLDRDLAADQQCIRDVDDGVRSADGIVRRGCSRILFKVYLIARCNLESVRIDGCMVEVHRVAGESNRIRPDSLLVARDIAVEREVIALLRRKAVVPTVNAARNDLNRPLRASAVELRILIDRHLAAVNRDLCRIKPRARDIDRAVGRSLRLDEHTVALARVAGECLDGERVHLGAAVLHRDNAAAEAELLALCISRGASCLNAIYRKCIRRRRLSCVAVIVAIRSALINAHLARRIERGLKLIAVELRPCRGDRRAADLDLALLIVLDVDRAVEDDIVARIVGKVLYLRISPHHRVVRTIHRLDFEHRLVHRAIA